MKFIIGLNMCLVPALLLNFGFSPCTFFCLALVPALYKTFGFSPSVKYLLKKTKLTVDQSWHATWHTKRQKNQIFNYYFIPLVLVPALLVFSDISPCTLVLIPEFFIFYFKKHSMILLCFIIVLFIIFIEYNHKKSKKYFFKKLSFNCIPLIFYL